MPVPQLNITIGTAGHIDHGKTALVKLLTGCDTDRLKEEKERGMSIDLGYAPCTLGDLEVGIVDVPGHEHFIKTMVAGASGMDGVVLVVAADDGIMPQTREHLDILTLLGLRHGLVALTKTDRVAPDHLERVRGETEAFLRGTFLEGAPICPLSNVTGEGFDAFYNALAGLVRSIQPKGAAGVFRLPVDRAFSARGSGTVVAGIPVAGSARTGDTLVLLPHNLEGRVSGIEVYGRPGSTVMAGQCAALNVRQWDAHAIARGHVVTVPGYFEPASWYALSLRLLPSAPLALKHGAEVKFHTGTSEVTARVFLMEGNRLAPGGEGLVQVGLAAPLVAGPRDRFIIRSLSPVVTLGGGQVVEAIAERLKRNRPEVHEDLARRAEAVQTDETFIEYCLRSAEPVQARSPHPQMRTPGGAHLRMRTPQSSETAVWHGLPATRDEGGAAPVDKQPVPHHRPAVWHGLPATRDDLAHRSKVPVERAQEILVDLASRGAVVALEGGTYVHREWVAQVENKLLTALREHHRAAPESPGLTLDGLLDAAGLPRPLGRGVLDRLTAAGAIVERSHRLALADHREAFSEEDRACVERIEALFREGGFQPPGVAEVVAAVAAPGPTVERLVRALLERERLVQVAEGLIFHREAVERARGILVEFLRREGRLESVRFKYLLDTTRKFAIPLLDYFDRIGVTRRMQNTRYLRTAGADEPRP